MRPRVPHHRPDRLADRACLQEPRLSSLLSRQSSRLRLPRRRVHDEPGELVRIAGARRAVGYRRGLHEVGNDPTIGVESELHHDPAISVDFNHRRSDGNAVPGWRTKTHRQPCHARPLRRIRRAGLSQNTHELIRDHCLRGVGAVIVALGRCPKATVRRRKVLTVVESTLASMTSAGRSLSATLAGESMGNKIGRFHHLITIMKYLRFFDIFTICNLTKSIHPNFILYNVMRDLLRPATWGGEHERKHEWYAVDD